MSRFLQRMLAAPALAAALLTSGCSDLPVVGPVVETLKPYLQILDPVLGPIKGMLGLGGEEVAPVVTPTPRPGTRGRRSPAAAESRAASGSVATQAAPTEAQYDQFSERNKEFDRLRTTGMMQLYGGETRMAIDSFEQAAKIRPEDPHIQELIELAKNPPRKRTKDDGESGGESLLPEGFLQ